ncbi:hypothetical protein [Thermohalobacter berrensis]|uniref:Uncharacterized protein n=1 Tax=Thermohalobacter berrensis TaxID=99594 RepID=A0A419T1V8_9FIRM|nr:hypothetical protein [Thermohalobacter berrensis]RKD31455.1 hypothetical protein BET03_12625 [Thermohalobacter berrensis]
MKRRFYVKTIALIVLIILCFLTIHTYNHVKIKAIRYTNNWGKHKEIGESYLNRMPLIGEIEDSILTVTFNGKNSLNYYNYNYQGNIIDKGKSTLEGFDIDEIFEIYLIRDKLVYKHKNNVYMTKYQKGIGFTKPEILLENVLGLNMNIADNKNVVSTYNKENISIYNFEDGNLEKLYQFQNKWNLKKVYFKTFSDKEYIFLVCNSNNYANEIIGGKIKNESINNLKSIDRRAIKSSETINQIYIERIDKSFFIGYTITSSGRERATTLYYKIIDSNTFQVLKDNVINDTYIDSMYQFGENVFIKSSGAYIEVFASGINTLNKYAIYPDIFKVKIDKSGEVVSTDFITYTQNYSKYPALLDIKYGRYLVWYDIKGEGYKLMLTSTNKEFVSLNSKPTSNDYKSAFLNALSSPFYAIAFVFLKGTQMLIYILAVFLPIGFIFHRFRVENEKLKGAICLFAYIVLNLILYKSTYFTENIIRFMPEFLKFYLAPYVVPLIINLISGITLYIFYSENKKRSYIAYIVFFIVVDVYFSNLLFVPFSMTKLLLK